MARLRLAENPETDVGRDCDRKHPCYGPRVPDEACLQWNRVLSFENPAEGPRSREIKVERQAKHRGREHDGRSDARIPECNEQG